MTPLHRILLASEPGKSGVFVVVRDLVRYLHREHPGITVDLAYSSRRQLGEVDVLAAEVRARGGATLDLLVGNGPELADFDAARRLLALVWDRRPQVVHAHSSKAGALCRGLALLPGFPPVIYTPHAYYGIARRGGAKEFVFNTIERIFGRAGITACCSEDERAFAIEVLKLPASRLVTAINGIDTHLFAPASSSEKAALRAQLGIPPDGRLLVTTGRRCAQKNYEPLYAAVDRALAAHPGFRFAHAGEGALELAAGLEPVHRTRVHAFDHLAEPQLLMRAADGFVLTSRYEGLSLSMLEALCCGTPTLLTDVPGLKTIREMGFRWTRWLPAPDGAEFAEAVEAGILAWLDTEPGVLEEQRALAVECFDQATQFEKLIALYRSRL